MTRNVRGNPNLPQVFIDLVAAARDNPHVGAFGVRSPDTGEAEHRRNRYAVSFDACRVAAQFLNAREVDASACSLRDELAEATGESIALGELIIGAAAVGLRFDDTRLRAPDVRIYGQALDCRREGIRRGSLAAGASHPSSNQSERSRNHDDHSTDAAA